MLGGLRRKSVSGASSALVYGLSWGKIRPTVSSHRACSALTNEIILDPSGVRQVQGFCHMPSASREVNLVQKRVSTGRYNQDVFMKISSLSFCSNSGAGGVVFEAVVPYMGESISDGTLAKFLKKPGDRVEVDEVIAQVETDKVPIRGSLYEPLNSICNHQSKLSEDKEE